VKKDVKMRIILVLLGIVLGVIGAKCIYDARELTNQFFHGNNKNKNVLILQIIGALCVLAFIVIVYYVI
jgi:K+ transporter